MKRLALLIACFSIVSAEAATFYVSGTNGNDAWSGTLAAPNSTNSDGPFRTLAHAQSVMNGSSTKTVTIRSGTYTLAGNITLSSGVTWIPFQNETPVIDGNSGSYGFAGIGVSNVTMEGLTFQNLNSSGLNFNADHITLRWNTFLNCKDFCAVGIMTNSFIDSNIVNGETRLSTSGSAFVGWQGSSGNTFSHNWIRNTQGGAIAAGDANDLVDRNLIENVNTSNNDWGAIYAGTAGGLTHSGRITNNVISGNGGVTYATNITKAIYLDDLDSNVTVSGNICRNCGTWAFQIHGGINNVFTNNIFDLSSGDHELGQYQVSPAGNTGMTGNVFQKNIIYTACTVPSPLWAGLPPPSGISPPAISHNLYYSACGGSFSNTQGDTSPVFSNPQFVNPAAGNYSMPSTSPAFTQIGFLALPTDQGPLPNPFRSAAPPNPPTGLTATVQ